jgi:hypothetical protein
MALLGTTLANLVTRTRRWVREDDSATSYWDDDYIKHMLNVRYRLRATELFMAHEGYFTIVGQRDVVANQDRYAWPIGFSKLLKMELVRTDGRRVPIHRRERHYEALDTQDNSQAGDSYFPTYRPVGSGFVLEPTPAQTTTLGLHLEWNGVPQELEANGDALHSDFPQEYTELLVLDAAVACFDAEGSQESGQLTTILRQRNEWEERWERFVDGRIVGLQSVTPFVAHYQDS